MKRSLTKAAVLMFCAAVFLTGCKKDEEEAKPKSKADLLTAKTWAISKMGVRLGDLITYQEIDSCQLDNSIKFNADGTINYNEGKLECEEGSTELTLPVDETSSWALTENETYLSLDSKQMAVEFFFSELTENKVRLETTVGLGEQFVTMVLVLAPAK